MKVNVNKTPVPSSRKLFSNQSFFDDSIGFWGEVSGVDSSKNRVRVIAATGMEFVGLPVASLEWVTKSDNYVSGEIRLPQVGSRVFVLMPTHTIAGAFVLCSGFAAGENSTHTLYSDREHKEENNKISKKKTQGGWLETENYETGVKTLESHNQKIKIELNPDESDGSAVITAFNTIITINETDGITLDSSGSEINVKNTKKLVIDSTNQDVHISTNKFTVGSSTGNVSLEVNG